MLFFFSKRMKGRIRFDKYAIPNYRIPFYFLLVAGILYIFMEVPFFIKCSSFYLLLQAIFRLCNEKRPYLIFFIHYLYFHFLAH